MSNFPRCATCKHWQAREPETHGTCLRAGDDFSEGEFYVFADCDKGGQLRTLPTWGCVSHEVKING